MISQPCLRGGAQHSGACVCLSEKSLLKFDDSNYVAPMKTGLSLLTLLWMVCASHAQIFSTNLNLTSPPEFLLINKTLTKLTFGWQANQETNIWGYHLYWGPGRGFYTNYKVFRHDESCGLSNCLGSIEGMSRTNRTWFALSAVNTELLESDLTTNDVHFPTVIGTNYVVTSIYETASSLDGPWTTTMVLTNSLVTTNDQFFIRNRMRVDRVP